jgi:SPX domain protein involved in polyphosphate accumulation
MKLDRQFENRFHEMLDELMKAWEIVDINRFMHINQGLAVLFTQKIQQLINMKHPTVTIDLETKMAEEKLIKLNTLLDNALDKKNALLKAADWEEKK